MATRGRSSSPERGPKGDSAKMAEGNVTTKVAVLGGGAASLTAAFELTAPELAEKYDVTVYQMGWRLGGKGASGRNAAVHDRIEEHGLHLWLGFLDTAFLRVWR